MPIDRDALVRQLDALLDPKRMHDYGPNGLQVQGRAAVATLGSAVSADLATCRAARAAGVEALLVHHGLLWGGEGRITGVLHGRLETLITAGISLIAYHLPLDAHPEVGNNAIALAELGAKPDGMFAEHRGTKIGTLGLFAEPITAAELTRRLERVFAHPALHCKGADRPIRRIGVVSGGGQDHLRDACAAGCDAFITGEATERHWYEAAESGCHLFACGHHATENIAVHRLGARLAREHGLKHVALTDGAPL